MLHYCMSTSFGCSAAALLWQCKNQRAWSLFHCLRSHLCHRDTHLWRYGCDITNRRKRNLTGFLQPRWAKWKRTALTFHLAGGQGHVAYGKLRPRCRAGAWVLLIEGGWQCGANAFTGNCIYGLFSVMSDMECERSAVKDNKASWSESWGCGWNRAAP